MGKMIYLFLKLRIMLKQRDHKPITHALLSGSESQKKTQRISSFGNIWAGMVVVRRNDGACGIVAFESWGLEFKTYDTMTIGVCHHFRLAFLSVCWGWNDGCMTI